jgi:hypothetical protein
VNPTLSSVLARVDALIARAWDRFWGEERLRSEIAKLVQPVLANGQLSERDKAYLCGYAEGRAREME